MGRSETVTYGKERFVFGQSAETEVENVVKTGYPCFECGVEITEFIGGEFVAAVAERMYPAEKPERNRGSGVGLVDSADLMPAFDRMGVVVARRELIPAQLTYNHITHAGYLKSSEIAAYVVQ